MSEYKTRTVKDLARFIGNKVDDFPAYSLLLGAGCSWSSNIRLASELIRHWKAEMGCEDSENLSYSRLFETRFDLPAQRQAFIEREISGALPAIGYAYLEKMIEERLFNTIFTTNFDDLVNEAFYLYGSRETANPHLIRPLLCSHDSQVSSISVTSQRPKIIKLHGDYLYEDLRSSMEETDKLHENTAQKIQEFAKSFGLVVIGYDGNDNSVMDVLNDSIKDSTLFRNGVYWCKKKGCDINNEKLEKLLSNNRVFLVEIDGFDEMMFELHSILSNDPIFGADRSIPSDLLRKICENPKLKVTESEALKFQLLELQNMYKKNDVEQQKGDENENIEDMSVSCAKSDEFDTKYTNLRNLFYSRRFDAVVKGVDEVFSHEKKERDKLYLLQIKADALMALDKLVDAKTVYRTILSMSQYNLSAYIGLIRAEYEYSAKLGIIENALKLLPYSTKLYELRGSIEFKKYLDKGVQNREELNSILERLEQGLTISNSVNNSCWEQYFEICLEVADVFPEYIDNANKVISDMSIRVPYDITVIEKKVDLLIAENEDKTKIKKYIIEATESCPSDRRNIFFLKLLSAVNMNSFEWLNDLVLLESQKYQSDYQIVGTIAEALVNQYRQLDKAVMFLEKYLESYNSLSIKKLLVNYYIMNGSFEEAYKMLSAEVEIPKNDNLWVGYYNGIGEIDVASKICEENWQKTKRYEDLIKYSYNLLLSNDYTRAKDLIHAEGPEAFSNALLLINYTLAKNKGKQYALKSKDKERIKKLSETTKVPSIKAASLLMLNIFDKALEIIEEDIKKEFSLIYSTYQCFVFNLYIEKEHLEAIEARIPKHPVPSIL